LFFTDSILGVKFMNNLELLGEIKGRLEREVWYQELRLNAKNPTFHMSEEATEVAINRKELAEGILKLIEKEVA
jgi:hypothetical protein